MALSPILIAVTLCSYRRAGSGCRPAEALAALKDRNWHGVELLRAGEVAERPAQEPHGTAWLEASEGRRGIIVYQVGPEPGQGET
jgi:hypothetical protein